MRAIIVSFMVCFAIVLSCVVLNADAKAPIGYEFQVNTYTADNQTYPAVGVSTTGFFVISWSSYLQDGDGYGIYAQMFDALGNPIGSEFQVNTYTNNNQSYTKVATSSTKDFVIVWQSYGQDGDEYGIYAQLYDANGNPVGQEFLVNTNTTGMQKAPSIAICDTGFVVVWQSYNQDGSGYGIYGQIFDTNGNPIGAEFQINTYTSDNQTYPAVAMASTGNFVVVWQSYNQDGSWYGIYGQRFNSTGIPIGSEFQINTQTYGTQRVPSVSIDREGNFVVVWQSYGQDGSGYGIYGQRFDTNGNPIGAEFQINTYTQNDQTYPAVCYAPNGEFIVTWSSFGQDGNWYGVYAQRFSPDGTQLGAEYQVNTYTTNSQRNSVIGIDGDGNSVIVWRSYGQDGDKWGIFAQRFDNAVIPEITYSNALMVASIVAILFLVLFRKKLRICH
jgi:hypothetical protein